jgi:hypothetical protein
MSEASLPPLRLSPAAEGAIFSGRARAAACHARADFDALAG